MTLKRKMKWLLIMSLVSTFICAPAVSNASETTSTSVTEEASSVAEVKDSETTSESVSQETESESDFGEVASEEVESEEAPSQMPALDYLDPLALPSSDEYERSGVMQSNATTRPSLWGYDQSFIPSQHFTDLVPLRTIRFTSSSNFPGTPVSNTFIMKQTLKRPLKDGKYRLRAKVIVSDGVDAPKMLGLRFFSDTNDIPRDTKRLMYAAPKFQALHNKSYQIDYTFNATNDWWEHGGNKSIVIESDTEDTNIQVSNPNDRKGMRIQFTLSDLSFTEYQKDGSQQEMLVKPNFEVVQMKQGDPRPGYYGIDRWLSNLYWNPTNVPTTFRLSYSTVLLYRLDAERGSTGIPPIDPIDPIDPNPIGPYQVKMTGDHPGSNVYDQKLEYEIETIVPKKTSNMQVEKNNQWLTSFPKGSLDVFDAYASIFDEKGNNVKHNFKIFIRGDQVVINVNPEYLSGPNFFGKTYTIKLRLEPREGKDLSGFTKNGTVTIPAQGTLETINSKTLNYGPATAEIRDPNESILSDVSQTVLNSDRQVIDKELVFNNQKLTFQTTIEPKIVSSTVLYDDVLIDGIIDANLEDVTNLKLVREDQVTSIGTVFYNSRTRNFQASITKADNIVAFEHVYLSYEATVKKDTPAGTKITAQAILSGKFTEGNTIEHDIVSNTVSVEVAKLFDLNHSVTGMTGQGGKAEIGDSLKYEVNLISHMKAITPPYLYKDFKFEIEIDKNLEAPTDLMFILPNGQVTPGEITYNPTTRKLTGITRETAGALGQRDIRIRYTAKVAKTAQAGSTIRAKTSAGGTYTQISSSTPVVAVDQLATVIVGEFVNEGTLDFVSAPNNFKYGNEDIQVSQENQEYKAQEDQALIIKDSRKIGSQWSLTARMTTVLTNGKYTLPESVYYRRNGIDQIIGENISANIFERKTTSDDDIRISDAWKGVETYPLVKVRGNTAHKGEYKGWIQWTLQDVP